MLPAATSSFPHSTCYFSLPTPHQNHSLYPSLCSPLFSPAETPPDPTHPLLADRNSESISSPSSPTTSTYPSLLQMQSAAAHGQTSRPRPVPVQNVVHVTSDDSVSSGNSYSSSNSTTSSLDLARCSRCQRTPSINVETGANNMVQYGLNLWYCTRCAGMVGLKPR